MLVIRFYGTVFFSLKFSEARKQFSINLMTGLGLSITVPPARRIFLRIRNRRCNVPRTGVNAIELELTIRRFPDSEFLRSETI